MQVGAGKYMSTNQRRVNNPPFIFGCVLGCLWLAGSTAGADPSTNPATQVAAPEFSRYLPVWTQAYVEVKGLRDRRNTVDWLVHLMNQMTGLGRAQEPSSTRPGSEITGGQFGWIIQQTFGVSSDEFFFEVLVIISCSGGAVRRSAISSD